MPTSSACCEMEKEATKKELAQIAGYTYRRLYDIDLSLPQEKKLFVKGDGGKYDLAVFVQRWVNYNVANEAADDDLEAVKAKHEKVKTQKTELEVARMRGQLIDVADVKRLWGDIANALSKNLLHIGSKVAPGLRMLDSTDVIQDIIDREVRTALESVADTPLPDYAEDQTQESEEEDDEEV